MLVFLCIERNTCISRFSILGQLMYYIFSLEANVSGVVNGIFHEKEVVEINVNFNRHLSDLLNIY